MPRPIPKDHLPAVIPKVKKPVSIYEAVKRFLENITLSRSPKTALAYRNGLNAFLNSMQDNKQINIKETICDESLEEQISPFMDTLKYYSPATERLYITAVYNFFVFITAEGIYEPNLARIKMIIKQRARVPGQRLPQFPRKAIDALVKYANSLANQPSDTITDRLRNLRDRAFLITLADTGLRVHEACNLRRGDIDWEEQKAVIIGKGDRQAVVRFSSRSLRVIKEYLALRSELDNRSGRPLSSLPLFARHDKGTGKKVKPITPTTGRNIVAQRVEEALGDEMKGAITPHSFRHFFVTTVLRGSGGNLKLAQALARHKNIAVTQRYAHLSDDELDKGYHEIFEQDYGEAKD